MSSLFGLSSRFKQIARTLTDFWRCLKLCRKFGCPFRSIGNNSTPLDFIEFFDKKSPRIIEIVGPLYKKGLSITDIANQTGLKRTGVWRALRAHRHVLRPQKSVSFDRWRQGRGKTTARPPYGYCYFEGQVVKNPSEYPTLLLIHSLWKQGQSISSIAAHLNSKAMLSRMKRPWSYNVIKAITQRPKELSALKTKIEKKGNQHELR